jgi:hypothetical protein
MTSNQDINKKYNPKIEALHYVHTYAGQLCVPFDRDNQIYENMKIIREIVPKKLSDYFHLGQEQGNPIIYTSILPDGVDMGKRLPKIIVYIRLEAEPITEEGDRSFLHLVIFQNEEENPFEKINETLKTIDWEKSAEDFQF